VTFWEIIIVWALGASVAVTFAILVVLAVIFWVSRKLD